MLLLLRYFFDFRGATLMTGAVSGDCSAATRRRSRCHRRVANELDVDGNGTVAPLADALLLLRFGFGFRGSTLISQRSATTAPAATRWRSSRS